MTFNGSSSIFLVHHSKETPEKLFYQINYKIARSSEEMNEPKKLDSEPKDHLRSRVLNLVRHTFTANSRKRETGERPPFLAKSRPISVFKLKSPVSRFPLREIATRDRETAKIRRTTTLVHQC